MGRVTAELGAPALSSLPADERPVFERLVAEGTRYFGSPVVRVEPVGTIERVFSTLRCMRVETAAASTQVYVKRLRAASGEPDAQVQSRVVNEFTQTQHAYEGLRTVDGLTTIRPLAVFPDLHVFVAEEARGETLQSLIRRGARRIGHRPAMPHLTHVMWRIGRWLRAYQSIGSHRGRMPLAEARSYVQVRMDRLCNGDGRIFGEADRERMLDAFDRWAAALHPGDLDLLPLHADFNPENILVDGDTVAVLDFSEAHPGLRYADAVHLFLHLEKLKTRVRFSPSAVAQLQEQLLEGYGEPRMIDTPLARLLTIQQAAAYLVLLATQCPRQVAWARGPYLRLKRLQVWHMLERLDVA